MKYVVDIPKNVFDKIKKWIDAGRYESVSDYVCTALENQISIEEVEEGEVKISAGIPKRVAYFSARPERPEEHISLVSLYPDLLSKESLTASTVPLPDESKINSGWLWGQYSKIFPVKLSLRMLANLVSKTNNEYVDLEDARKKIAAAAREMGCTLKARDKLAGRAHGEKYSAGLPTTDKEQKTLGRYETQFVGYMTKDAFLGGAPADLKFVNMVRNEKGVVKIGLTDPGKRFALLENPVIDTLEYSDALSEKEKKFYINHVFKCVPGEAEALRTVLSSVKQGIITPATLNRKIGETEEAKKRNWSQAVINTMRAGAVSRFCELGLLARKKNGIRATYVLTEEGKKYVG